ncbi:MAG: septum formation initiator family protein [Bacteroidia bacterium]|nr:septum formation initiator family protein [Bacteroidota bacterium]MCZ2130827.1 septum formation initiator family protein [Bacteroidia bacterium]
MKIDKDFWLKYRYFILIGVYGIWITFFDFNSLISLAKISNEVHILDKENEFYKNEIESAKRQREYLFSNSANLEKFSREKYLMKKDDEDVFIIVEEKKK